MAISRLQSVAHFQTNSVTNAVTTTATQAGSLIVVMICEFGSSNVVQSITDDKSNTYTHATGADSHYVNSLAMQIYYAENAVGGVTTVTAALSPSRSSIMAVAEYSGIKTSSSLDAAGATTDQATSSSPALGPSLISTVDGELIVTSLVPLSNSLDTVAAPWTLFDNTGGNVFADIIAPVAGTYQVSATPNTSQSYTASGVTFFAASSFSPSYSSAFLVAQ